MKKHLLTLLAVTSFAALTLNLAAQADFYPQIKAGVKPDTNAAGRRVVFAQTNSIKATVEDIDYAKRHLTLKGPEGNTMEFKVSDEVRNFPQVKKGDEIKIGFYESVALSVAKPGEEPSPTARREALVTAGPGQKPAGVGVSISDITATVEDIDREKREVTLKGPEGNTLKVKVDPSVGNLQRINKGDQIKATHTEALAVSVETSQAQPEATRKPEPQ